MLHSNILKISENIEQAAVEICLQVTYPRDFWIIRIHSYYEKKVKLVDFLKHKMTRIKMCIGSYRRMILL